MLFVGLTFPLAGLGRRGWRADTLVGKGKGSWSVAPPKVSVLNTSHDAKKSMQVLDLKLSFLHCPEYSQSPTGIRPGFAGQRIGE